MAKAAAIEYGERQRLGVRAVSGKLCNKRKPKVLVTAAAAGSGEKLASAEDAGIGFVAIAKARPARAASKAATV